MASLTQSRNRAYLLLANGTLFEGYSFGVPGTMIGEVVFTTSMTGYQETLTDPSYYGQIVTQTFPLIGNYGVNHEDYESSRSWVQGYIVREWCDTPSNFRSEGDIDSFLKSHGIVGICGIDTRQLTRIIREHGVMNGAITTQDAVAKRDELLERINSYEIEGAVEATSLIEPARFECEGDKPAKHNVVLMDYGYKYNIRHELTKRGCSITIMPASSTVEDILAQNPDGIMLSNGPGDPSKCEHQIEVLRELTKHQIPTFGICLGHQLLALANGAQTMKLKYGHRGANQPVVDNKIGKVFITSQNHGYAVVGETIDPQVGAVSHENQNDNTCEGVEYINCPAFTVQFHPESCSGPNDTNYLFDRFLTMMEEN